MDVTLNHEALNLERAIRAFFMAVVCVCVCVKLGRMVQDSLGKREKQKLPMDAHTDPGCHSWNPVGSGSVLE